MEALRREEALENDSRGETLSNALRNILGVFNSLFLIVLNISRENELKWQRQYRVNISSIFVCIMNYDDK